MKPYITMKKTPTSILTLTLAAFVLTAASTSALAVPSNKVPGTGYHDGRIKKGTVTTVKRKTKADCCSRTSSCDHEKSQRDTKRKPYWRKKISG
jgi:hypothetical protein